jgi:hypothetical protein
VWEVDLWLTCLRYLPLLLWSGCSSLCLSKCCVIVHVVWSPPGTAWGGLSLLLSRVEALGSYLVFMSNIPIFVYKRYCIALMLGCWSCKPYHVSHCFLYPYCYPCTLNQWSPVSLGIMWLTQCWFLIGTTDLSYLYTL